MKADLKITAIGLCLCLLACCGSQNTLFAQETEDLAAIPLVATPTPAPTPPFPELAPNFDKDFKIASKLPLSGRIAFTARIRNFDRLLLLDIDSSKVRALIDGPGNNFYPDWSPDGSTILFVSDRDGNKELYVADWNGARQRRLTYNSTDDANPAWHPDGKHVVYYSETGGRARSELFMLNIEKPFMYDEETGMAHSTAVRITSMDGRNTTPRFSPDGEEIAFSTNRFWPGWDLCIWNLRSKRESCPLKGSLSYCRPSYSQDGKSMLYATGSASRIDIGILEFSSGTKQILTRMPRREYDAVFAPDTSRIIFVAEGERSGLFNMYSKKNDEPKEKLVLKAPYSMRYLSWTPKRTVELEAERIKALEREKEERKEVHEES